MTYQAHESMIAPARARAELWRLAAGLITIVVMAVVLNTAVFQTIKLVWPDWFLAELIGPGLGTRPLSMLIVLFSFLLTSLAAVMAVRLWHQRGLLTLFGPIRPALRDFWAAMRMLVPVLLIVPIPDDEGLVRNLALGPWLGLLPLALLGILVQSGTEEIIFRGYIQQQLAARFDSPIIWMIVPATLFAISHYNAALGQATPYVIVWALLFGLAAADLTARAGNLGPAIAMHLANNAFAMLIVSTPDELSGLALYHLPFSLTDASDLSMLVLIDCAHLLVAWLACRLGLRR